jgi:hypothetical protein
MEKEALVGFLCHLDDDEGKTGGEFLKVMFRNK